MNRLTRYIILVAAVTISLFVFADIFYALNHSVINRNPEAYALPGIPMPDGSIVTNYDYSTSPFYTISHVFGWVHLVIPPFLVLFLSVKYLLAEVNRAQYLRSLFIPLCFGVVSFLVNVKNFYEAVGMEVMVGFVFLLIYVGVTFGLVVLICSTLYFFKRQK